MKKFFLLCAVVATLSASDIKKVVYNLTTSSLEKFEQRLIKGIVTHKTHYENNLQELDVIVVIHGDAYKFFLKNPMQSSFKEDSEAKKITPELAKRLETLASTYDVKFWMCASGAKKHKIAQEDTLSFVKMIPNAAIGLIDAQNDGYAYMPLN
jgi:intracellular sulfur oxidation DsrE/DsrF family protein